MGKRAGNFELRYEGGDRFEREMKAAAKDVRKDFTREARYVAQDFRADSRKTMPVRSGAARRDVKHFAQGSGKAGVRAGVRGGLVYQPALHFATRGSFGRTMRQRYGRRPRFAFQVMRDNREDYSERLLRAVAEVAERVAALER